MDDGRLFAEVYPALRRFAAAITTLGFDPDDLVQEAVARTLRRGKLTDLDDANRYLRRVILNLARNHHRDSARRGQILTRLRPLTALKDVYPSDFTDLSSLTVEQRAVLFLRFVENHTNSEIAALLDISEEAVRARTSRAIRALRIELEQRRTADEQA